MSEEPVNNTLLKALSVLEELQQELKQTADIKLINQEAHNTITRLEKQIAELKLENERLKHYSQVLEHQISTLSEVVVIEPESTKNSKKPLEDNVYIVNCESNECVVLDKTKGDPNDFEKTPFVLRTCSMESCSISKEGRYIMSTPSTLNLVRLSWSEGRSPSRVLIITKKGNDEATTVLIRMIHWLQERDIDVFVEPHVYEELGLSNVYTWKESDRLHLNQLVDFIITLGGDGTLLFASTLFHKAMPPVISFNMGTLGFLTSFFALDFPRALSRVIAGDIPLIVRVRFEYVIIRDIQSKPFSEVDEFFQHADYHRKFKILNDIVIDRGTSSSMVELLCYIEDDLITTVHADGLIIATPTGSTAYSMSAGGSMVHPLTPGMLMTPICPHTLSFRQMVFPDNTVLRIEVSPNSRCPASVSFDGQFKETLNQGDAIIIRMSKYPVPSISHEDAGNHWFRSVRDGLHWNIPTSPLFAKKESQGLIG